MFDDDDSDCGHDHHDDRFFEGFLVGTVMPNSVNTRRSGGEPPSFGCILLIVSVAIVILMAWLSAS